MNRELMVAASQSVRFNSPVALNRARTLAAWVAQNANRLLDAGCGRGEMMMLACEANPRLSAIGVDVAGDLIDRARAESEVRGLTHRATFLNQDLTEWTDPVDAAICSGAEHAFGGLDACAQRLAEIVPRGRLIMGAAYWQQPPNKWCVDAFGQCPDSLAALCSTVRAAGWTVHDAHPATLSEWDGFETEWRAGVERVGTKEARSFADLRRRQYEENYRSVLGFGWLQLQK